MGLTEIKRKGRNVITTKNGHTLLYTGVENNEGAAKSVDLLINKNHCEYLTEYEQLSGGILSPTFKFLNNTR